MFAKAAIFIAATLALVASASPLAARDSINNGCNTGPVQCCSQMQSVDSLKQSSAEGSLLVKLLALDQITGQIGSGCSSITGVGLSGSSCSSQPVCCTGNQFNGLINVGCTPINLNA